MKLDCSTSTLPARVYIDAVTGKLVNFVAW